MRSFRGFMMRVLIERLVKIKQKIRSGIGAEGDDSSAYLFDKTPVLCYDNDCKISRRHKYNEIIR